MSRIDHHAFATGGRMTPGLEGLSANVVQHQELQGVIGAADELRQDIDRRVFTQVR